MQKLLGSGALSRFRVVDLSQVRAGPTCVKQFADFGADVIKVEPPASVPRGELYVGARDGADMQNLHRNKRSITLNLKSPRAKQVLEPLLRTADVVVENFRPDVKDRLGLDYKTLSAINPRVILVSISGFGQEGPYRDRPGFDQVIQGMCGLMSATGTPEGPPTRTGASVIDVGAGLYAALGAMTALLEREQSGKGQWVQCSLLHVGVGLMDYQAARYLVEGDVAARMGNEHPTSMPTSAYPTADGFINIGAGGDDMWRRLCRAFGQPELADDPDFLTDPDRVRNRERLNGLLGEHFRSATTAQWMSRLADADVPCGPIYTMDQVFADPQVQHSRIAAPVVHPRRGEIRLVDQVVKLTRTPAHIVSTLEDKGGSNDEVLGELGLSAETIAELRSEQVI
ncbi:MAG TPA: CoA transferase [Paraburkholderia sp.]|uniref:CaiB/BaiF CoA transferase family protein n=1 Tax=Paraburkholderia sp. TaxID=1926495 RepID=UPI002B49CEE5|nr:CoA transferase [Paraburkholderia sp.]HKR38684.1 CoA transferase [Paraburkholderia sp.]